MDLYKSVSQSNYQPKPTETSTEPPRQDKPSSLLEDVAQKELPNQEAASNKAPPVQPVNLHHLFIKQ